MASVDWPEHVWEELQTVLASAGPTERRHLETEINDLNEQLAILPRAASRFYGVERGEEFYARVVWAQSSPRKRYLIVWKFRPDRRFRDRPDAGRVVFLRIIRANRIRQQAHTVAAARRARLLGRRRP